MRFEFEYTRKSVNPEAVGFGDITVGIVGEAPWKDEIIIGRPFVGTSGLLLRGYFDYEKFKYFIVNSTCCTSFDGDKMIKPSDMDLSDYKLNLPPGSYLFKVVTKEGVIVKRILIK